MPDDRLEIRSFSVVFDLERRIHSIDRFRIPLPYGLPLRSLAYFAAALVLVLMASRIPLVSVLLAQLPAPARYVVVPMVVAAVLTQLRVDGRCAHDVAVAWISWRVGRARDRRVPTVRFADVPCVPDERGAAYRSCRLEGPGEGLLRLPYDAHPGLHTLTVRPRPGGPLWEGTRFTLQSRQQLRIR